MTSCRPEAFRCRKGVKDRSWLRPDLVNPVATFPSQVFDQVPNRVLIQLNR